MNVVRALKRLRFEVVRRLDAYRGNAEYRWTHRADGNGELVVYRAIGGGERELRLRGASTDLQVFIDVFHNLSYSTRTLARDADIMQRYNDILAGGKRPLIIDAGANVGMASLYFRDRYPEAVILAVEPDDDNFAELCRNTGSCELVVPLQAALAPHEGTVEVVHASEGAWAHRTRTAERGVPAHTISRLVELAGQQHATVPFLLKIDIEGYEAGLFDEAVGEIDRFYVLLVEPHDWMLPRQRTTASLLRALASLDRDFLIRRENVISISNADPAAR